MDSYLDPIYSNFDEMNTLNAETSQSAKAQPVPNVAAHTIQ